MQLSDRLEAKFRLDGEQKRALHRLRLFSVSDLLFYFPTRYSDISELKKITDLVPGELATVYGKISNLKTKPGFRGSVSRAEGEIADVSGKIKIIWFNQVYLAKMLRPEEAVKLTGKVTQGKTGIYLANPQFEKMKDLPIDAHESLFKAPLLSKEGVGGGLSYPIYPETRGITSRWFYHALEKIFRDKTLDNVVDYIPADILKKYNLPSLKTALVWIHKPKNAKDAESARKRFAFEEVFCIQLERQHDKYEYRKNKSFKIKLGKDDIKKFLQSFPFEPTGAQKKSIEVILSDMGKNFPMSRLLEGDVGSGKTAVAATAAYQTVQAGLQVAYMAPTEILATQHFESFVKYFNPNTGGIPINIGLITGSGCRKFPSKLNPGGWTTISRAQLLRWVVEGVIPILIGTHALIQKSVKFKNLALAVIDEQHRFGTAQRRKLVRKDAKGNISAPHLLSMTATPIPRTLALTIYGDLDLSLLDEMPAGRKKIITEIIPPDKRDITYEQIRKELKEGRQMYVICPRIFEVEAEPDGALAGHASERLASAAARARGIFQQKNIRALGSMRGGGQLEMKSVTAEAKRLKKEIFPEYEIGILHSKMSKEKKEKVMQEFAEGKINILCATSVVEVGVDVPNATVIIIEGAERFGLAQLHQLRGRVLRSTQQAYCYIFAKAKIEKTLARLKALKTAQNGFELAELDLTLRGAGELSGEKQWGITDLGMEAIRNIKMVEAARAEATRLIEEDPELTNYPLLKEKVRQKVQEFHFE